MSKLFLIIFSSRHWKSFSVQQRPRKGGQILSYNTKVINIFRTHVAEELVILTLRCF